MDNSSGTGTRRKEVLVEVHELMGEDAEVIIPLLDKLQILGRMTQSTVGQTLQPSFKVGRWRTAVDKAMKVGILRGHARPYFTHKGRMSNAYWLEATEKYKYEPLWVYEYENETPTPTQTPV